MPHEPPKLALETLSIRDFRGIESLDLDFRGPDGLANRLVVIGGPNGCGKTTVLESAICLLDETHTVLDASHRRDVRRGVRHFILEGLVHDSFSANPKIVRRLSSSIEQGSEQAPCYIPLWYFPSTRTPGLGQGDCTVTYEPNSTLRR